MYSVRQLPEDFFNSECAFFVRNRAEEMNNSQLTELEDDMQQQLARTEERVRQEASVTIISVISYTVSNKFVQPNN